MIAEIYGKISSSGSNLSERLEDNLTGNIFGTLRYLPYNNILKPFLEKSYRLTMKNQKLSIILPDIEKEPLIDFWPKNYPGIEPDIRIKIKSKDNSDIIIFIEAKYFSGLSSDDSEIEFPNIFFEDSKNQLIRQIKTLRENHLNERKIEIYLTKDYVYPETIMNRVENLLNDSNIKDVEYYWLSWHDITPIIKNAITKCQDEFKLRIMSDMLNLCDKKSFNKFSGIHNASITQWKFNKIYYNHPNLSLNVKNHFKNMFSQNGKHTIQWRFFK